MKCSARFFPLFRWADQNVHGSWMRALALFAWELSSAYDCASPYLISCPGGHYGA